MALELDIIQRELKELQMVLLTHFKELIGCEICNILFVTDKTRELMLFTEGRWFRVPMLTSIAGACAMTGEPLHIPDAYADSRFNRYACV